MSFGVLITKNLLKLKSNGLILAGHGVSKTKLDPFLENVHVHENKFLETIELLERLDVEFIDYQTLKQYILKIRKPKRVWVHFTFDDGYKNNLDNILPIMNKKNIPFTVFVSTYHIEHQLPTPTFHTRFLSAKNKSLETVFGFKLETYYDYENYLIMNSQTNDFESFLNKIPSLLNKEEKEEFFNYYNNQFLTVQELKELARHPLVTIASHAHHHLAFHEQQNQEDLKEEVLQSFKKLKTWDIPFTSAFCYPNGIFSKKTIELMKKLDIEIAFASNPDFINSNSHPLKLPRFWIRDAKRVKILLSFLLIAPFLVSWLDRYRKSRGILKEINI
ncbi:MAG: polysaccharide deacetylase family protein [Bdellovibrionales bacterium]|nr:polysaccharide deacetylase family protein [Bdellovibrionales bacterium]